MNSYVDGIPLAKRVAGEKAAEFVEDGMVVGLGSGSTIIPAVHKIADRMEAEELKIIGIPTSEATAKIATGRGIPLSTLEQHPVVDLTIDGADEVAPDLQLIKGLGGALVREKIVAKATKKEIIVIDPSKLVKVLGTKSPLPVEIVPFCWAATVRLILKFGCEPVIRTVNKEPYTTDNHNYILDCKFEEIASPHIIESELNDLPGVVDNGLFLDIAKAVIVGDEKGGTRIIEKE